MTRSAGWWIFLLAWFALPWGAYYGLQLYGESVPQSVRRDTRDLAALVAFVLVGVGGWALVFLGKRYALPRLLIGFLATFYLVIGLTWSHVPCGPQYIQAGKPASDCR